MDYIGNIAEDDTVHIYFVTSNSAGAAVAPSGTLAFADFAIYKNDSAAQKVTSNGFSITGAFDGSTSIHVVTLDTSNNTGDTGFWEVGNNYTLVLNPATITIDSQSVEAPIAQFAIENRYKAVDAPLKNVALNDIPFYMVDSTDHITPETGLSVTAQVSKDGAALGAAAGTVTAIGNGLYAFDATAADMNGDLVVFRFTATGADPEMISIKTVIQ